MGVTCIPAEPAFDNDTGAERVVWTALREQLPEGALLMHSVRLQDGPDQREIDLLVAWPGVGIAVVEVKGGPITCTGGVWKQSSAAAKQ